MNYDNAVLSCGEGGQWGVNNTGSYGDNLSGQTGNIPLQTWWYDNWYPAYHWYYPQVIVNEDKMSKAFRIVKSLMDKKIFEAKTIKQFIDLVDTISKEL